LVLPPIAYIDAIYYSVDYVKDPKGSNYWRNRVLKVAQDYKRKVYFAVSNKDDFAQVGKYSLLPRLFTFQI